MHASENDNFDALYSKDYRNLSEADRYYDYCETLNGKKRSEKTEVKPLFDQNQEMERVLSAITREMFIKADAFALTGNFTMALWLLTSATELRDAQNNMNKAVHEAGIQQYKDAEVSAFNVLHASLAGITIGQQSMVKEIAIK